MSDLIEALTILLKYGNPHNPTNCSHDMLTICGIVPDLVNDEDKAKLAHLGFNHDEQEGCFYSYRYGSA
jgi:hypothetical protein